MTRSRWRLLSLVALTAPSGAQEARAVPPCRQPQVELRVANAGVGMSHWAEGLEFLNKSADTCFLRGVPKLVFDGENNARLAVAICPNCDDYLFPARPETTVILKSRETSHVLVGSSTAYDSKFCGRTRGIQVFLPGETRPLFVGEHELYYCVKVDVSAFLPGPTKNDSRWDGRTELPPAPRWGPANKGVQVSLTPFSHWQRLGILGFHLALRGLEASGLRGHQCQSATLRIWQEGKMVQSVTSTDHLVRGGRAPLRNAAAPEELRTDVTTQEFGMTVNNAGTYEFDLVETLDGGQPITVTSDRTWVMVTNN